MERTKRLNALNVFARKAQNLRESSMTTENKENERVQIVAHPVHNLKQSSVTMQNTINERVRTPDRRAQNLKQSSVTTESAKKMNAFKLLPVWSQTSRRTH